MTIDKLGPINPVSKYNKTEKVSKPSNRDKTDSISFSEEAKSKGEVYKITEEVKLSPEIRQDRIDEVKKKLEDPNYIDEKVVEMVAEKVMDLFEL
ncbi:MAG: flagellar biosynthesis anti-sigma factor FlgM [Spirochaetales bacterium]|jgi:negative regulator of flagellin synthesis FlgM|nr:flagellar biosynthesis anti-sigma factor FlgM [Spirochaetales bacterium]